MTISQSTLPDFGQPRFTLSRAGSGLMAVLLVWDFRHRSRHSLGNLPPHLLRDIGLDLSAAQDEAAKPFWRD